MHAFIYNYWTTHALTLATLVNAGCVDEGVKLLLSIYQKVLMKVLFLMGNILKS